MNISAITQARDTIVEELSDEATRQALAGNGEVATQIEFAILGIKQSVASALHLAADAFEKRHAEAAEAWAHKVIDVEAVPA
jgi:hypothetical protein